MRILVVRGTREALAGVGMEDVGRDDDLVAMLPPQDETVIDTSGQRHHLRYIDADPADEALVWCLQAIKRAWEREFPEETHLGHAAAGNWFFYWFAPRMETMTDLLRANRGADLRAAARDFIAKRFGWDGMPDVEDAA